MRYPELARYLDDLAARLDRTQENANRQSWNTFWTHPADKGVFSPILRTPAPSQINWPKVLINDAFENPQLMLLREFEMISAALTRGSNARLNVRSNYSTGILPVLFGCDLFMMDRDLDTLPTAVPLHDDKAIVKLVSAGVPDLNKSLGGKVFEVGEAFVEIMKEYPAIAQAVEIYHPDLQGPIDVAEVIWGSEIFYAFGDEPQLVHDFLALVTQTYIDFMKKWQKIVPPCGVYNAHWGMQMKGDIMLRNDSLMNLSPQTYVEFIRGCDQRIFDEFNGGGIHFCGRGDHYIEAMSEMRSLSCITLSQPHYNNMETIYRNTIDKGIRLLALPQPAIDAAAKEGRNLRGLVSTQQ